MARAKSPAPVIATPQTRAEAADWLRQIGEQQRVLARIEADLNDRLATAQEIAATEGAVPSQQLTLLTQGLQRWCEANRAALTDDGRTKTADLGTGRVSWRLQPARVLVRRAEEVIARLKELRYRKFVRIKEEVDKEAILAAPATIRARLATIPGLTIGSAGEVFAVEPFAATLGDAATPAEAA